MTKSTNQVFKKKNRKPFFETFTEIIGWLQIVASPLFVGVIIGGLIYLSNPTNLRLLIGISIAIIGLLVGIIWATRIWKKSGTVNFVSRISASPELDNLDQE